MMERTISPMTMIEAAAGDGTVLVEIWPAHGSERTSVEERVEERADQAIKHASATVTRIATELTRAIRQMAEIDRPQEFVTEFGIKFTAEGNAMIAKASAEASLKVTLTYRLING